MIVYADIVFLVNFAADLIVLRSTALCMHKKVPPVRLSLFSALGGIYAVCAAVWRPLQYGIIKTAFSVVLTIFTFKERSIGAIMKDITVFYTVSFILCGIVSAVSSFLTANMLTYAVGYSHTDTGLSLPVLTVSAAAGYMLIPVLARIFKRVTEKKCFDITLEYNGVKAETTAFTDTGSSLCEPLSKTAVVVADRAVCEKLIGNEPPENIHGVRIIPYRTIDGSGSMYAVKAAVCPKDGGGAKEVYMAISKRDFDGYHVLMPVGIFE